MEENMPDTAEADNLKKYRQAAYGFLSLNLIYIAIFYVFLPPFNIEFGKGVVYTLVFLVLIGVLSYFIYKGSRKLTIALAVLYAIRSGISVYTLVTGEAFAAVPYVLPCLFLTFYLLARAAWKWP